MVFGLFEDNHKEVNSGEHEGKFSHELIAGAASFAAARVFEDKQRKEGKPVSHAFAKEALAGFAGAEVDKLFETKGLDYLDRDQVKDQARDNVQRGYDEHYGGSDQWDPSQPPSVNY